MHTQSSPLLFLVPAAFLATSALPACGDDGGTDSGADGSGMMDGDTNPATGDETASDSGTPGCNSADAWAAPDWESNAAEALALRAQLDTLVGDATMRGAETGEVTLADRAALSDLWDGDPSLLAVANPGYVSVVDGSFDEFMTVLAAGDQSLVDEDGLWSPGPDGGLWGDDARGINEGGLEVRQLVDKGGYSGGILYSYALGLTEGEIDAATIDAIAAAWGSNEALDPNGDLTDAAGYSHDMGLFAEMAKALADAKVFADQAECTAERDEALVLFFNRWEQAMYARMVFYGNRAEGNLLAATNETELAGVLRDLAEGIGVAAGFIGLPDPASGPLAGQGRIITDEQIGRAMAAFGVDLTDLGASTTGTFVESLPNLEAAVEGAEGVVMEVYGVDAATIATYAMPTPG